MNSKFQKNKRALECGILLAMADFFTPRLKQAVAAAEQNFNNGRSKGPNLLEQLAQSLTRVARGPDFQGSKRRVAPQRYEQSLSYEAEVEVPTKVPKKRKAVEVPAPEVSAPIKAAPKKAKKQPKIPKPISDEQFKTPAAKRVKKEPKEPKAKERTFKCGKCKCQIIPAGLETVQTSNGGEKVTGSCPNCEAKITRVFGRKPSIKQEAIPQKTEEVAQEQVDL